MSKAIFIFEGQNIVIQCSKEDKMRDICLKFTIKANKNINDIYFLYDGKMLNLELKFNEIIKSIDYNRNEMNVLVFEKEKEGLICPKCGESIKFDNSIYNIVSKFNNNVNEQLKGLKDQLEIIINSNDITLNKIIFQLKNIIFIINNIIQEIKKNNEQLYKINSINNESNLNKIDNMIIGIINIEIADINKDILLFKSNEDIDVYINNEKINVINREDNKKIYNFQKEGQYEYKLVFKNIINNLKGFFSRCNNLILIDLSNFNSSKVTNIGGMFNECFKLKEIRGINNFNTSNVTDMNSLFQFCSEVISLDLSNFNTSKVTNMGWMFNECHKLKEIKGITNFNTGNTTNMNGMFQKCYNIISLDLSNFNTSNVTDMGEMFNYCSKLKEIKGINNFNTKKVTSMIRMFKECNELKSFRFI